MKVAGIEIGRVTTKVVILEDDSILYHGITITADKTEIAARKAIETSFEETKLKMSELSYITASGMIRKGVSFADEVRSSAICLAKGANWLFPDARTVIDVGAENVVVLNIDKTGRVGLFTLNDKCAAGAGVFLESLAKMLNMSIQDMAEQALKADKAASITSTCTIFAEQEVLSHAFDVPPVPMKEIIAGLHASLAGRVLGLAKCIRIVPEILLCGGVAKNPAFVRSLDRRVKSGLRLPEEPQIVPALGAALFAMQGAQAKEGD